MPKPAAAHVNAAKSAPRSLISMTSKSHHNAAMTPWEAADKAYQLHHGMCATCKVAACAHRMAERAECQARRNATTGQINGPQGSLQLR